MCKALGLIISPAGGKKKGKKKGRDEGRKGKNCLWKNSM
jgi:hypothetical protein